MKKMIISVLLAMIILMTTSLLVFAHPESFVEGSQSTVSNLITIRKPDTSSVSTVKTTYSITGVGSEGVNVSFYLFDGEKYAQCKNADGTASTYTIGTSGVFYRQLSLAEGANRICVRAEASDGTYQLEYFTINVVQNGLIVNISTFSLDMQSKLNGWLN